MIYRNIIKTYTFVMKKIFFIITFTVILTNIVIAQNKNNQVKFPLKKSDYIMNVKKNMDSNWTYGKDEINFNDYSERIIKAEEERTKNYIANLKVALEKEFKNLSNNKSTLSKSDFISVVSKIEESNFDLEDANKDGVITEEEHKNFLAKQKKTQATTPAPKK
jgi:hypothetical protein